MGAVKAGPGGRPTTITWSMRSVALNAIEHPLNHWLTGDVYRAFSPPPAMSYMVCPVSFTPSSDNRNHQFNSWICEKFQFLNDLIHPAEVFLSMGVVYPVFAPASGNNRGFHHVCAKRPPVVYRGGGDQEASAAVLEKSHIVWCGCVGDNNFAIHAIGHVFPNVVTVSHYNACLLKIATERGFAFLLGFPHRIHPFKRQT